MKSKVSKISIIAILLFSMFLPTNVLATTTTPIIEPIVEGLHDLRGIAVDSEGTVYYAYNPNGASGVIKTVQGNEVSVGNVDGMAVDGDGNVFFIAQGLNNIDKIRKLNEEGTGFVDVFTGLEGRSRGLDVDQEGNLYIADFTGKKVHVLDKEKNLKTITLTTMMGYPYGIVADNSGGFYISTNNPHSVYYYNSGGVPEIVAGVDTNYEQHSEVLDRPGGLALDSNGNLYIADAGNNRVLKRDTSGLITTIAEGLNQPIDVAVDSEDNLYVASYDNGEISKILFTPSLEKVENLAITDNGIVSWDAVENASGYELSIHGNDDVIGPFTVEPTSEPSVTFNILTALREAGVGTFNITVKALGDGEEYLDGAPAKTENEVEVKQLPTSENLKWQNGTTAAWDAVSNAVNYTVELKKGTTVVGTIDSEETSYDFKDMIIKNGLGNYNYAVQALANENSLWLDSEKKSLNENYQYIVSTEQATTVTTTTAQVTGKGMESDLDDMDVLGIEYAMDEAFTTSEQIPVDKVTVEDAAIQFTVELDDLIPNTTYYYRAYVEINSTSYFGFTESFTTEKVKSSGSGGTAPPPALDEEEEPNPDEEELETPEPSPAITFKDIEDHWAKNEIEEMVERGIIVGYPDGTFRPSETIKRKHVAVMFNRFLDLEPKRVASSFSDVSPTHDYYEEIMKLQRAGIINGSNGAFKPDAPMTRAQMSKIIVLALDLPLSGTHTFKDVPTDHWANAYIATLAEKGITLGDNGNFRPDEAVTRAQFVAFLSRALAQ